MTDLIKKEPAYLDLIKKESLDRRSDLINEEPLTVGKPRAPPIQKKPRGRVKGSKNKKLAEPFCIPGLEPNLTTKEAADYLRRSIITLAIWRTNGGGPKYWKSRGRILYHKCDLEAFQQGRRSTSEEAV